MNTDLEEQLINNPNVQNINNKYLKILISIIVMIILNFIYIY